jgi:cytochrome P450
VTRPDPKHLAFAYGPHFCVGAPLGRLEAEIAFSTLLSRCPQIALADQPIEWQENATLRGLKRLQVTVGD